MRRSTLIFSVIVVCVALVGCADNQKRPTEPATSTPTTEFDPIVMAMGFVQGFGWEVVPSEIQEGNAIALANDRWMGLVDNLQRQVLGDVVHYWGVVRTGPGQYDRIGIHRVVKETAAYKPIRTKKAVFLQHGASVDFINSFLPGLCSDWLPDDFGIAVFLARNDIDVWGVDQAWCLVPPEETDFAFMADWGLPRLVDDLGVGVRVARLARRMTGNGWDQILLLGYSFGAEMGFGLLDGETRMPPGQRQIKGYIPVDMTIRSPLGSPFRELLCAYIPYYEGQLANGIYGEGAIFRPIGELARDDPEGESPFFPGMTNLRAALTVGTTPLYGPDIPFHVLAGVFDGDLPVGMQYVPTEVWIDFLCSMSAVEPNLAGLDQCNEICGGDVPRNQQWNQIRVPIFYVGAGGGHGDHGTYQLSFLGSGEVSSLIVSTDPSVPLLDFGHIDLFIASNAPELVWAPICAWILDHTRSGSRQSGEEASIVTQ